MNKIVLIKYTYNLYKYYVFFYFIKPYKKNRNYLIFIIEKFFFKLLIQTKKKNQKKNGTSSTLLNMHASNAALTNPITGPALTVLERHWEEQSCASASSNQSSSFFGSHTELQPSALGSRGQGFDFSTNSSGKTRNAFMHNFLDREADRAECDWSEWLCRCARERELNEHERLKVPPVGINLRM